MTDGNDVEITVKPTEFLLVVPEARIREVYGSADAAIREAQSFLDAGVVARVWNYKNRLIHGRLR